MTDALLVLESDVWNPVSSEDLAALSDQLDMIDGVATVQPSTTTARRFLLPFYSDCHLVELQDPSWRPQGVRACYLEHQGELTRLNGDSKPIHRANARYGLDLTEATAPQYLSFFCFFIHSDEGPFLIVDRLNNSFLPQDPQTRATLSENFRPVENFGRGEHGGWRLSGLIYYGFALFYADFLLATGGMIEMVDDVPAGPPLTARIDAPLTLESVAVSPA